VNGRWWDTFWRETLAKKDSKGNDGKELQEKNNLAVVKESMTRVCSAHDIPKMYQAAMLEQSGYRRQEIAFILDTSARYVSNSVAEIRRNAKKRQRLAEYIAEMPKLFRGTRQIVLPLVAAVQDKGLQYLLQNPNEAVRYPQILKQVAAHAGIHEDIGVTKYINIGVAIQIQNHISEQQKRTIAGEIVDVETE
jgi:hypothetical protein